MSNSRDSHIQHAFDSYCKKIIRNEARNIQKNKARIRKYQTSLSDLTHDNFNFLQYEVENIVNGNEVEFLSDKIQIIDSQLFNAVSQLSENKKSIIILFYFLGFNDREIAEIYRMSVSGIWYQRKMAIKEMKKFMGG